MEDAIMTRILNHVEEVVFALDKFGAKVYDVASEKLDIILPCNNQPPEIAYSTGSKSIDRTVRDLKESIGAELDGTCPGDRIPSEASIGLLLALRRTIVGDDVGVEQGGDRGHGEDLTCDGNRPAACHGDPEVWLTREFEDDCFRRIVSAVIKLLMGRGQQ